MGMVSLYTAAAMKAIRSVGENIGILKRRLQRE